MLWNFLKKYGDQIFTANKSKKNLYRENIFRTSLKADI